MRMFATCVAAAYCVLAFAADTASAGSYYIYACSTYSDKGLAFSSWSDSEHLNAADMCMQPAPQGGYRSFEIDNPGPRAPVFENRSAHWILNSPSSAISIIGAYASSSDVLLDCLLHTDGFTAEFFWGGGSQSIDRTGPCDTTQGYGYGTGIDASFGPSSYFGWGATCSLASTCATSSSDSAVLGIHGIRLTVQENTGPTVIATQSNNLWYQGGHWVRGGGWPVGFAASDPSGVCGTDLLVNGAFTGTDASTDSTRDTSNFTQCWLTDVVTGTLNTDSYANGPLTIEYAADNAAGVVSGPTETLQVDNTPVSLALSTPNDADPNVWVNHPVEVTVATTAGPSGLGGTDCSTNSGPGYAYPSSGITLNGTGIWNVACSSWNNALDASGQSASSPTESVSVHIDETPPALAFERVNPADPQAVVVDTSDAQSGVAGGQIEMRPAAGGNWQTLATQFDGQHLIARFDDATLAPGGWVIQATSCDHAGNCAAADSDVTLPVRTASLASVSFANGDSPMVAAAHCSRTRSRREHPRREKVVCTRTKTRLKTRDRVPFGKPVVMHGLLTTAEGKPIGDAAVSILSAPDNGLSQYTQTATATTNAAGVWSMRLGPGPSRLIAAVYGGSLTIQPAEGWAKTTVPARIQVLRVWPRRVAWDGKVHIRARLLGGYLPPGGALVRLRLGYGNARITYGVKTHVAGDGIFEVTNTFGPGPPSLLLRYWLQECTLPEGDYPFAPACGPRDAVTVGG